MDPPRQSEAEARAYRLLGLVLIDLRRAERTLVPIYDAPPDDPERAADLAAIRATIAKLHRIVASQN